MSYAFPTELADQVIARWQTFVARHDSPAPPLPSPACLRHILETAFFASFAREEGRCLRFALCCSPSLIVPRDGVSESVPVLPFESPRPLTADAIRSLAPAVSPNNAAILVRCETENHRPGDCEIAGVVSVGSNLARARSGRSFYHRPAPYALVIDVRDAGEMHIYRSGIKLAMLKSGSLRDQLAFSGLEFLPISNILVRGGDALRARIQSPRHEPARETADFEWTALVNTILSVVNGVREHGHGGALLLVAPGSERTIPIRVKFDVVETDNRVLSDSFVSFLNSRHELAGTQQAIKKEHNDRPTDPLLPHLQNAAFVAEENLADAADLAARLSAVDGALVVSSDLRIIGFGAEIVLDATRPLAAYEITGNSRRPEDWPVVDSESFGMRHRSALRCVAVAENTAAFVVSQDGTVNFFWKQGDRVLLKRDVNTTNPNMVGA